jgi:PqqD family protein of HPr-rel-A system
MTDYPARTAGLDISAVDDGYVVYDPQTDLVHYLNPTAAVTLELCDGGRTAAGITTFLNEMFSVSGDDVLAAVTTCIGQLRDLGLLQPAAAPAALARAGRS